MVCCFFFHSVQTNITKKNICRCMFTLCNRVQCYRIQAQTKSNWMGKKPTQKNILCFLNEFYSFCFYSFFFVDVSFHFEMHKLIIISDYWLYCSTVQIFTVQIKLRKLFDEKMKCAGLIAYLIFKADSNLFSRLETCQLKQHIR